MMTPPLTFLAVRFTSRFLIVSLLSLSFLTCFLPFPPGLIVMSLPSQHQNFFFQRHRLLITGANRGDLLPQSCLIKHPVIKAVHFQAAPPPLMRFVFLESRSLMVVFFSLSFLLSRLVPFLILVISRLSFLYL